MFGANRFALYSPEDGEPGGGAAGGDDESHQDEKDVVPKSQMIAAINSATEKMERALAAQRSEFEAKLADARPKAAEAPKVYTKAELTAAVEAGQINQAQADAQIEFQNDLRAAQIARDTVLQETQKSTVDSQLAEYKALVPGLLERGEVYQKVKAEFDFLRSLGDPNTVATELKAIRAVHGPLDKLRAAKSGRTSHESQRETGGEGGAGPRGGKGELKLTERQREHYAPRVGRGKLYPDWKAVEAELNFATRT